MNIRNQQMDFQPEYRLLSESEISRELFGNFNRRQVVTRCWRREKGKWVIRDISFMDQWSEEDYVFLVICLKNTVSAGGAVYGAFVQGKLKGFASVEAKPLGSRGQYRDLTSLHVSEDMRRRGMGRKLFSLAAGWARAQGAEKLYLSAHSAVETQAFYHAVGCVEAEEYDREHAEQEPCDCQMEYQL